MRSSIYIITEIGDISLTEDFGLYVESPPKIVSAVRKTSVLNIPGASQPLVRNLGGAENIQRVYDVFIDPESASGAWRRMNSEGVTRGMLGMLAFDVPDFQKNLYGIERGYFRLTDDYISNLDDYSFYFKARFNGGVEFENSFLRRGRGKLVFDCVPRMYIKSKPTDTEYKTELTNVGTSLERKSMAIVNPFGLYARGDPLIRIEFQSNVNYLTLTVNGYEMLINLHKHGADAEVLVIDSELKNCWYETNEQKINGNADVTFNTDFKFPELISLPAVITAKTTSGIVDKITVIGRWYIVV